MSNFLKLFFKWASLHTGKERGCLQCVTKYLRCTFIGGKRWNKIASFKRKLRMAPTEAHRRRAESTEGARRWGGGGGGGDGSGVPPPGKF